MFSHYPVGQPTALVLILSLEGNGGNVEPRLFHHNVHLLMFLYFKRLTVAFMVAGVGVEGGVVIRRRRVIFRLIGAILQRRRDFPGRQDKD